MSITPKKTVSRAVIISFATLALILTAPLSTTWARPGFKGRPLPHGRAVIHAGPRAYFFLGGLFYLKGPRGYVVAPPPVGAVIAALPPGAILVRIDGTPYYTYSDVYFKRAVDGYVVVSQPIKQISPEIGIGQKLKVNVELLNVRSGPGLQYEILHQLPQGTVVEVEALRSEWCMVRVDNKISGWIKSTYTTILPSAAKG